MQSQGLVVVSQITQVKLPMKALRKNKNLFLIKIVVLLPGSQAPRLKLNWR